MNTNFLAKSAVLATAATMRARAESSGASPAKDDVTPNGNGANGNDNDAGKSKKKKKNKKRNSRSSLTAEDSVNGPDGEEGDVEESLSGAPSPVVTTTPTTNEAPSPPAPVEVADTVPFEWNKPVKDELSLLDLSSPAPVSSGSPFDVFDSADADATSNKTASAVVMPPTTPVADAASSATPPAVDLAELFESQSPVQAPGRRAPPPPPSTTVVVADPAPPVGLTLTRPPVAQAPTSPSPLPAARVEPEAFDLLKSVEKPVETSHGEVEPPLEATHVDVKPSVEAIHVDVESPASAVPVVKSEPIVGLASLPSQVPDESAAPTDTGSNPFETLTSQPPAPMALVETISVLEKLPAAPPSPTDERSVTESSDASTITAIEGSVISAETETATVPEITDKTEQSSAGDECTNDLALSGGEIGEADLQVHSDTTFEAELAALATSPSPSPVPPTAGIEANQVEVKLPASPQATLAPPGPVVAKAYMSKSPAASAHSTKRPTNGTSTPESKTVVTKSSARSRQAPGTQSTTPPNRAVPKTVVPKTPPKQVPKSSAASPSAASVAARAAATKIPGFQRSLSASTAVKKPAKSPTNGNTSPTLAHSVSSDNEPKVAKKKLSASEIDAAGNRLYEQAMESKRRLEAKKALREEEFTFTPQVNPQSKKLDNADAPNRFVMLHERAKDAQRKKEELREKLEKEECTFKPQITNKAKKIASSSDTSRFENLYRNASEIQAKREEKKKQESEKNEEEFTFKPKIKATKSPVRSRPLYDPEVVKQKRLELEQKRMETELQTKPKVVRKTRAEDGDNKIFDRLYQGGQQRTERLAKLKQEREEQEKASTTFQPKVSSAAASNKASSQPFHQRLYDKDHLKKVAAEREQKKLEEEKRRFSFKPRVSDIPDGAKSKGSSDGGSTGKSTIFERLYQDKNRVKEKIELSEELKIQKEMEECTFRPQIDPPTSATSKGEVTTPIWERLLSIDKNQIADERDRQKAQLELEACTFRPEISSTPGSLSPKRASSNDIFERLSTSAGNTPVDEKKRRPSERKSIASVGKRNSYNERGLAKEQNAQRRVLSVGDILKSSKLGSKQENAASDVIEEDVPVPRSSSRFPNGQSKTFNGSSGATALDPADNVARSLDMELNEPDVLATQSKSILENYDTWAAGLEEKMRNL